MVIIMTNRELMLNMTIGELLPKMKYSYDPYYIRKDILSVFLCDIFECEECPIFNICGPSADLRFWLDSQTKGDDQ